mmetsp:Transcript_23575/g.26272  ORF Transcript_23575/g.26272 Transcript_23575/m.26272 type:complete len:230 (+) Transcript_23575:59-748(+)
MTIMVSLRLFFVVLVSVVVLPVATSYSPLSSRTTKSSTTTTPRTAGTTTTSSPALFSQSTTTRRDILLKTTFVGIAASSFLIQQPSMAEAATAVASKVDLELIKTTSDRYRLALIDKDKFIADMATEQDTTTTSGPLVSPLPPQIPAITFQKLAKVARTTEKVDSDDFPFVAIEYAEHAGAARDFAKLSRLGRIGENGSPEVALDYAKRCVLELEEASVILDTLRQAVE